MPYERHCAPRMHPHFYPGSQNRSISKTKQWIINHIALCPRSITGRKQFIREGRGGGVEQVGGWRVRVAAAWLRGALNRADAVWTFEEKRGKNYQACPSFPGNFQTTTAAAAASPLLLRPPGPLLKWRALIKWGQAVEGFNVTAIIYVARWGACD